MGAVIFVLNFLVIDPRNDQLGIRGGEFRISFATDEM
jgi:hypothetical protein